MGKNKVGRPPAYNTAEEMQRVIDQRRGDIDDNGKNANI